MSNITVVLGEIYGDVSYGVDYTQFIIGAYSSPKEADQRILELKDSTDTFITNDGRMLFDDDFCGMLSLMTKEEFLADREDDAEYIENELERSTYLDPYKNAKQYKDFAYRTITIDNNFPSVSASTTYLE